MLGGLGVLGILTASLAIYLDSLFQLQVFKLPSMLQPMKVLDKKHAEKGKNPRRNPCKSYAFESEVLCDVLS